MTVELKSGEVTINWKEDAVTTDYIAVGELAYEWLISAQGEDSEWLEAFSGMYFFAAALYSLSDYDVSNKTINDLTELYNKKRYDWLYETELVDVWDAYEDRIRRLVNRSPMDKTFEKIGKLVDELGKVLLGDNVKKFINDIVSDQEVIDGLKSAIKLLDSPEVVKALEALNKAE